MTPSAWCVRVGVFESFVHASCAWRREGGREQVYSARRVVWPNRAFMAQLIAYEAVLAAAGRFRPPPPCAADPGGAGGVQPNRRSNRGAGDGVHCGWAPSVTLVEWDRWTAFDPAQGT